MIFVPNSDGKESPVFSRGGTGASRAWFFPSVFFFVKTTGLTPSRFLFLFHLSFVFAQFYTVSLSSLSSLSFPLRISVSHEFMLLENVSYAWYPISSLPLPLITPPLVLQLRFASFYGSPPRRCGFF